MLSDFRFGPDIENLTNMIFKTFFLLLFGLIQVETTPISKQAVVRLSMTEVMVIPSDENMNSSDYFFRNINDIRTDSDGSIYISDSNNPEIRKYDSSGIYEYTIGRRGRGPGEFQEISAFTLGSEDRIIMFDHLSQRLSWRDTRDSVFSASFNSESFHVEPQYIFEHDNKLLVFRNQRETTEGHGNLLHFWNFNADEVVNSAIASEEIWDLNQIYGFANATMMLVDIQLCENGDLLIAPHAYEGDAWIYKNFPEFDERIRLRGFDPPHPEHRKIQFEDRSTSPYSTVMYSGSRGRFVAQKFNQSMGIFEMDDWIIHFIQFYNQNKIEVGVNIFSREGEFLGYNRLPELESGESKLPEVRALWLDHENYLYIADQRELPRIRKYAVKIETE